MRVVLDTNVLISALMTRGTPPDRLYEAWRERRFQVVSCERQLEEIKRVSKRPFFRKRLRRSEVGRLVRDLRRLTVLIEQLPRVSRSLDPDDDYLLALAQAGNADFLATGDKSDLLTLKRHRSTRIVTAGELARFLA